MLEITNVDTYVPHNGTIKVGGSTGPKITGRCALHFYEREVTPIDFVCIGANANQQATKAMGVFRYMLLSSQNIVDVSFQPLLFKARVHIPGQVDTDSEIIITVWRTILLRKIHEQ